MVKNPQGVGVGVPFNRNDRKSNENSNKKKSHNVINVLSTLLVALSSSFVVWIPCIMICKCDAFYHTNLHHSSSFSFSFRHDPRRNSNTYATTTTTTTSPTLSSSSLVLFSSSTRTAAFRTTAKRNRRNIRRTSTIMAPFVFPCEQTQQEDHYRRCQQLQALRGDRNPENEEQERASAPPSSFVSLPMKDGFDNNNNSGGISTTGSSSSSKGVATATAPTTRTPDLPSPPSNKALKVVMGLGFASVAFLSAFSIAFIMTTPSIN